MDIIQTVMKWNLDAKNTAHYFNVRQTALYTGLQCEEMAEKLQAIGLHGAAADLDRLGKELKQGLWDKSVESGNPVKMIDADADIMVVTVGSAMSQGANFHGAMAAVLLANEKKRHADGKLYKDANGKIIKPAGWKEPDLSEYVCYPDAPHK